jgi:hypothetical protein
MFILFRFVRDEPGLIRDNYVNDATVNMPAILARFGHYFSKVAFVHCTVRSQFCRRRLWLRIIRRYGFGRIWIFVHNLMAYARVNLITVLVSTLFLSLLLPVMTVRFRIRGRVLLLRARILPVWARILPIWLVVAWLRFMLHGEVFGYHLKGPGRRLHGMWFVGK